MAVFQSGRLFTASYIQEDALSCQPYFPYLQSLSSFYLSAFIQPPLPHHGATVDAQTEDTENLVAAAMAAAKAVTIAAAAVEAAAVEAAAVEAATIGNAIKRKIGFYFTDE